MKKPNVMLAGFPKSGGTYLLNLLRQHPDIFIPKGRGYYSKEVNFFTKYNYNYRKTKCSPIYKRGLKWYFSLFDSNKKIRIDPSAMNALDITSAQRIKKFLPNIKILFITRNKGKHRYSIYRKVRGTGNIPDINYEEYKRKYPEIVKFSEFEQMIKPFKKAFEEENVLVLKLEGFIENEKKEINKALKFLGLKSYKFNFDISKNKTKEVPYSKKKRIRRLINFFLDDLGLLYYIHLLREEYMKKRDFK